MLSRESSTVQDKKLPYLAYHRLRARQKTFRPNDNTTIATPYES